MEDRTLKLTRAARAGDKQAFTELVAPLWPRLFRLCLRFVLDPGRAEDLAQEALTRAWLRLPQLREDAAFAPWLLQTAANLSKNDLRRRREDPVPEEALGADAAGEDASQGILRKEQRRVIEEAMRALPPTQRVAVELVLRDGLSYREAAAILGVPLGTLKTFVHRARERLKRSLAEESRAQGGTVRVAPHV